MLGSKFQEESQTTNTKEGSIQWNTPTLNGRAAAVVIDATGKNRFREEFVTAGGVALSNIDLNTLECKAHPGLFFAGEVLDIDAITGGFNLQAAWSTGYICARSIAGKENLRRL